MADSQEALDVVPTNEPPPKMVWNYHSWITFLNCLLSLPRYERPWNFVVDITSKRQSLVEKWSQSSKLECLQHLKVPELQKKMAKVCEFMEKYKENMEFHVELKEDLSISGRTLRCLSQSDHEEFLRLFYKSIGNLVSDESREPFTLMTEDDKPDERDYTKQQYRNIRLARAEYERASKSAGDSRLKEAAMTSYMHPSSESSINDTGRTQYEESYDAIVDGSNYYTPNRMAKARERAEKREREFQLFQETAPSRSKKKKQEYEDLYGKRQSRRDKAANKKGSDAVAMSSSAASSSQDIDVIKSSADQLNEAIKFSMERISASSMAAVPASCEQKPTLFERLQRLDEAFENTDLKMTKSEYETQRKRIMDEYF